MGHVDLSLVLSHFPSRRTPRPGHQAPVHQYRDLSQLRPEVISTRLAANKLKFLAGRESGAGVLIDGIIPGRAAQMLREAAGCTSRNHPRKGKLMATMQGLILPGNSTVRLVEVPVPEPGYGQVLLKVKASSICGSDIRAIYREHLGSGPEAYQGVIAGHEPCGKVVSVGPGCRRLQAGDRVVVYHIAGCGVCEECRHGYMVGCQSPSRAAHGWQRDGGHAEYLLAQETTCILLPGELSYVDGALVSCGFGTAYEALLRLGLSGYDRLLVTGLGPVGLAAAILGRAMGAGPIIGADISPERLTLAQDLGLVDHAIVSDDSASQAIADLTGGRGCEATVDCSGSAAGRLLALQNTRTWGGCAFVGEGGQITFAVSELLIHRQVSLYGSWVTSLRHMEDLLERLVRWNLHPEVTVTDRFALADGDEAYRVADRGASGKVCIVFE